MLRPKKGLIIALNLRLMAKDLFLSTQWIIFGVLLDELMSWNDQSYQIILKLNRTTGILSKLRKLYLFIYSDLLF